MGVIRRLLDSRVLWWALGIALVLQLSGVVRRGLARDPRFDARPVAMRAEGPAWGGRALLEPVMESLDRLGAVNLFDPRFERRIVDALAVLPGVESVESIRRHWPRAYSVEVRLRKPVAVVAGGGRRVPVTAGGIVLPPAPYREAVEGLLVIEGVREPPPEPGAPWRSEHLADGLATVRQFEPFRDELAALRVVAVDVSRSTDPSEGVRLRSAEPFTIRWGRPRATVAENSVEYKIGLLRPVTRYVSLVHGTEIDLRFGHRLFRDPPEPAHEP